MKKILFVLVMMFLLIPNLFAWRWEQQVSKDDFGDEVKDDYYIDGENNDRWDDKYIWLYFSDRGFSNGYIFFTGSGGKQSKSMGKCQINVKQDNGNVVTMDSECKVKSSEDGDLWFCSVEVDKATAGKLADVFSKNRNPALSVTRDGETYLYGKVDCSEFYTKADCIKGKHNISYITKDATCTKEGRITKKCADCSYSVTYTGKLPHKFNSSFVCKACGLSLSLNMVKVGGGSFTFEDCDVTLSDYYISDCEVTQKAYEAITGGNPSYFKWSEGGDLPVEQVSWYDAVKFCNKLSETVGLNPAYVINGNDVTFNRDAKGYRLPTEAEWEYASRGGNKSRGYEYSGSEALGDAAWVEYNSFRKTHSVKTKPSNELGLHDMNGNVSEWCWDRYGESHVGGNNPVGPDSGSERVIRGGSFTATSNYWRFHSRKGCEPEKNDDNDIGFRVARSL